MTPPVRGATGPLRGAAVLPLVLLGCLAPRSSDTSTGSTDELGEMMHAAGAEPVRGTVEPGRTAGLEPDPETLADPTTVELQDPDPVDESPCIRFGERIILRDLEDGTQLVTKPYFLPVGRPDKVVQLIRNL